MIVDFELEKRFAYHNAPRRYETWPEYETREGPQLQYRTPEERAELRAAFERGMRELQTTPPTSN